MHGLTIFSHSFRQVSGNFGMAVRISGGFWILLLGVGFVYGLIAALSQSVFLSFIFGIALVVFLVWGISLVAVVWHRYVLLEERPSGFLPYREGLRVWPYFWYGIGIAIIVFLALLVLFLLSTLVLDAGDILAVFDQNTSSSPGFDLVVNFIVGLLASLIYLRMALILPAVALDERLTLSESWNQTKGYSGSILIIAAILALLNSGGAIVFGMVVISAHNAPLVLLLAGMAYFLFQWFYFMLNISILSTLYGHIVQKREVY